MTDRCRLHYRPTEGWFGDPIPFYWDGVYHVFYDKLQTNGRICWAHIASRDLVNWEEMPDAVPNGPEKPDEAGCLTGSIIEKDGVFYAFYTGCGAMGSTVCRATSHDLVTWIKDPSNPVIKPEPRWYADGAWRDPCVVWNPEAGCYWMVLCGRTPSDGINPLTGCLALATSPDLHKWSVHPPIWTPRMSTAVECPDLFSYGEHWVLLHFWHQTRVRLADSPSGPWHRPAIQAPDSFDFFSGKTMWDGRRRVLIGWLPRRNCDCTERTWGGDMLLPREWYLLPDGTPATRCVPEVIAAHAVDATEGRGAQVFKPSISEWTITRDSALVELDTGKSALSCWADAPADYYFHSRITFAHDASAIIVLRGQASKETVWGYDTPLDIGYALHLDPVEGMVSLRKWYQWDQRNAIMEIPFHFLPGKPVEVELFLYGDILEVFLCKRRSLVSRLQQHSKGSLSLLANDGWVTFDDLCIRKLQSKEV